ncbi:MAG: hypothetical protein ABFD44_08965, partial [Anaerolineaceae bacterium]
MVENNEPTGSPSSEMPETPQASVADLSAGPQKNWFKRFVNWLLSPNTRLGRFNRAALRTLAWVIGFFALGVLVSYLVWYRPMQNELKQTQADLTQAREESAALLVNQGESTRLKDETLQARLDLATATAHINLLNVITNVQDVRYYVSDGNTAKARIALGEAKSALEIVMPDISQMDVKLGQSIQERFSLVEKELTG